MKAKLLFLLIFFATFEANALSIRHIDVVDIPGKPGKCKVSIETAKRTIDLIEDCKKLESEAVSYFENAFSEELDAENSSSQGN